jgi:hypothetical protein
MPRAQDAQERRVSVSHGTPIVRCDCVSLARHTNGAVRLFQSRTALLLCGAIVNGRHNYGFLPPLSPVIKEEY